MRPAVALAAAASLSLLAAGCATSSDRSASRALKEAALEEQRRDVMASSASDRTPGRAPDRTSDHARTSAATLSGAAPEGDGERDRAAAIERGQEAGSVGIMDYIAALTLFNRACLKSGADFETADLVFRERGLEDKPQRDLWANIRGGLYGSVWLTRDGDPYCAVVLAQAGVDRAGRAMTRLIERKYGKRAFIEEESAPKASRGFGAAATRTAGRAWRSRKNASSTTMSTASRSPLERRRIWGHTRRTIEVVEDGTSKKSSRRMSSRASLTASRRSRMAPRAERRAGLTNEPARGAAKESMNDGCAGR